MAVPVDLHRILQHCLILKFLKHHLTKKYYGLRILISAYHLMAALEVIAHVTITPVTTPMQQVLHVLRHTDDLLVPSNRRTMVMMFIIARFTIHAIISLFSTSISATPLVHIPG